MVNICTILFDIKQMLILPTEFRVIVRTKSINRVAIQWTRRICCQTRTEIVHTSSQICKRSQHATRNVLRLAL
jgi:hypothetical protein